VDDRSLEARLESLAAEVRALGERVLLLESRLRSAPEGGEAPATDAGSPVPRPRQGDALSWGATSTVLSRTALVCFVLVVALILRTATDNQIIGVASGAALGAAYAAGLFLAGAALWRRRPATGSVLSSCGVLLLCSVVAEASGRLGVFSVPFSYATIVLAALGLTLLRWLRGAATPLCLGIPAIIITGVVLGWPRPSVPGLAAVLLAANLGVWPFGGRSRCAWLRLVVVLGTGTLAGAWALNAVPEAVAASWAWFAVAATSLGALQVASAFWGSGSETGSRGPFDAVLPSLAVAWAYPSAAAVVPHGVAGAGGLLGAALLGALAAARAQRPARGRAGPGAFLTAAALLLGMALPRAGVGTTWAALLLAGFAMGAAVLSGRWRSGGARLLSYGAQSYAVAWGAAAGGFAVATPLPWERVVAAGAAAGVGWLHYRWSRTHPPPEESGFFARWRGSDDLGVIPLLASLVFAFLTVRLLAYPWVASLPSGSGDAFAGVQSVIIHLSAATLVVSAYFRKDGELRAVGLLVTGIGAVKALLLDLLSIRGLPLVASVLTFGAAAAVIALVLGRWHGRGRAVDKGGSWTVW
jgi:hypothetical protein